MMTKKMNKLQLAILSHVFATIPSWILNRPFATGDHVVHNPPCWWANSLLFPHWDIKTKRPEPVKLDLIGLITRGIGPENVFIFNFRYNANLATRILRSCFAILEQNSN